MNTSIRSLSIFLIFLLTIPALACRYTVREIGFADFGTDNYQLYFYKDQNVSPEMEAQFKRISYAALLDANVQAEIIDISKQKDNPAMKYYNQEKDHSAPIAVLVNPDKTSSLTFHLEKDAKKFKESVWTLLEDVITSAARIEILMNIVKSYAVVLFIESSDSSANKKVLDEIDFSIKTINSTKDKMPKPVDNPPALVVLKHDQLQNERVLLWSLGLKESSLTKPAVVILYGRGRIMGQSLQNALLQQVNINNLLTIVGADCECGLDRTWILGKMLPIRWDKRRQKEVQKWHKFDAENPFVKAEMSQILSISPDKVRKQGALGNTTLYGYTEGAIKVIKSYNQNNPNKTNADSLNDSLSTQNSSKENIYIYIILFFIFVVVVGVIIFIRSKKRAL